MIRRAVLFELRIYRNIARWVARRPDVKGGEPFGYAQLVTPVLCLWIFGSAVETVVVHFIVPWEVPRLVLDVLGVWGLLWMLGLLAGMRVYPHLVTPDALRVRHGGNTDLALPWDGIESLTHQRKDLDSSIKTLRFQNDELFVAVNNEVNIRVVLTTPIVVKDHEVTAVSFLADDPKKLVARAKAPAAQ